tara:strand:- start:531 stop:1013 length:483 start_codon:yes stop_codon:yes gene_type:complete
MAGKNKAARAKELAKDTAGAVSEEVARGTSEITDAAGGVAGGVASSVKHAVASGVDTVAETTKEAASTVSSAVSSALKKVTPVVLNPQASTATARVFSSRPAVARSELQPTPHLASRRCRKYPKHARPLTPSSLLLATLVSVYGTKRNHSHFFFQKTKGL